MKATAAEVIADFGQFADKALIEPIIVTKHGRDHLVILSAEKYGRLLRMRRSWRTVDAPKEMVEAVRATRMDDRHVHLDQLLADDPK